MASALLKLVFAKKEESKNRIDPNSDHNVTRRKSIHQLATEAVEEEQLVESQRKPYFSKCLTIILKMSL